MDTCICISIVMCGSSLPYDFICKVSFAKNFVHNDFDVMQLARIKMNIDAAVITQKLLQKE